MQVKVQERATDRAANPAHSSRARAVHGRAAPLPARVGNQGMIRLLGDATLPAAVRAPLERSLGYALPGISVHADPGSNAAAGRMGARAFTYGEHIYLGPGERPTDLRLMAHEVAHVIQQGRSPALLGRGGVTDGSLLEQEAEMVAEAAVTGRRVQVTGSTGGRSRQTFSIQGALKVVGSAGGEVVEHAMAYIKEHATAIPGYDLLGFVLGRDPITQAPVERNAGSLVKALTSLVPGGAAIFKNMQESRVLERAFEWTCAELGKLGLTWEAVWGAVKSFLSSLGVSDVFHLGAVFERARALFSPILTKALAFAGAAVHKFLELVFEAALTLAGGAGARILAILRKVGAVFSLIVADPVRFLKNLLAAVTGGFARFADNILSHLKTSLFEWLLGALHGAGLDMPKKWDLAGILSLVFQVLGLTYGKLRARLVKVVGEPAVAFMEDAFEFLRLLVTRGIAAAWEKILEFATGLVDSIIEGIRGWVATTIVKVAVSRIAAMFNPVGAVLNAIIVIYDTVMFVIERARQLAAFVESVVDSLDAIAQGNIGAAIASVEGTLARTLTLVIGFLARLIGLGGISEKVGKVIRTVQDRVEKALDRIVDWIAGKAKAIIEKGASAGRQAIGGVRQWWKRRVKIAAEEGPHELYFEGEEESAALMIASTPSRIEMLMERYIDSPEISGRQFSAAKSALGRAGELRALLRQKRAATGDPKKQELIGGSIGQMQDAIGADLRLVLSRASPGSHANPIIIQKWPKPEYSRYPVLWVSRSGTREKPKWRISARKESERRAVASLHPDSGFKAIDTSREDDSLKPLKALGIRGDNRIDANNPLVGPLSSRTTPGAQPLYDVIARDPFEWDGDDMDGDHVREVQFGGDAGLKNLWPLSSSVNRSAGSRLSRLPVDMGDGREITIDWLKKVKNKRFFFKIMNFTAP
jgi:hypothetical protein